jgi:hypothetical protein
MSKCRSPACLSCWAWTSATRWTDSSADQQGFSFHPRPEAALALIKGHTTGGDGGDGAWQAHWVLRDAAGLLTGDHGYWNSYEASSDVLTLAAGDYTLEVSLDYGPGGSIAVRVDSSGTNAIQVVAGHGIGELFIRFGDSGASIYRVDLAAGDEYLLQAAKTEANGRFTEPIFCRRTCLPTARCCALCHRRTAAGTS